MLPLTAITSAFVWGAAMLRSLNAIVQGITDLFGGVSGDAFSAAHLLQIS